MKAIVVGAGVAGPVAAMALQRAGIEVVVHESHAPADGEVGSWFTVTPNGLDALDAVGSLHLAREIGLPTRANIVLGATGRELGRLPLGRPLSDGTPALTMSAPACRRPGAGARGAASRSATDRVWWPRTPRRPAACAQSSRTKPPRTPTSWSAPTGCTRRRVGWSTRKPPPDGTSAWSTSAV